MPRVRPSNLGVPSVSRGPTVLVVLIAVAIARDRADERGGMAWSLQQSDLHHERKLGNTMANRGRDRARCVGRNVQAALQRRDVGTGRFASIAAPRRPPPGGRTARSRRAIRSRVQSRSGDATTETTRTLPGARPSRAASTSRCQTAESFDGIPNEIANQRDRADAGPRRRFGPASQRRAADRQQVRQPVTRRGPTIAPSCRSARRTPAPRSGIQRAGRSSSPHPALSTGTRGGPGQAPSRVGGRFAGRRG